MKTHCGKQNWQTQERGYIFTEDKIIDLEGIAEVF